MWDFTLARVVGRLGTTVSHWLRNRLPAGGPWSTRCANASFFQATCDRVGGTGVGMSVAFVFPGQGSQSVGMGKALADAYLPARQVFAEIDAALGDKLTTVMWEGPAERLMLTENAQPALVAVSLAAMRVLETEAGVDLAREAQFVAGHSVGEYSALAAAGSI